MKKEEFLNKFRIDSGVLRVARGGSRAKAPPLAARRIGNPPGGGGFFRLKSWGGKTSLCLRALAKAALVCVVTQG